MTGIKAMRTQETTCLKHQVWACACQHLFEFIKEAFADPSLFQLADEKSSYAKRKQEPEKRQLFDYEKNKAGFLRLAPSGLTINEISKFFNPSEFSKLKRMLKQDESLKELLPREIYFNLFELTPMEQETKKLLEKGLTRKAIAQILCVSKNSVRVYEWRLRQKQGLPMRVYKWKVEKLGNR